MHVVVHERGLRNVTLRATPFAEEDLFTSEFTLGSFTGIKPSHWIEFRRRGKIDDVLHLRHHRHMVESIRKMDALALRTHVVAVEIRGTLLELSEILDRTQGSFRSVNSLVEHPSQAHRIKAKTRGLRPDVRRLMKCRIGVEIGVAVEASHAEALIR